ncbi:hypothetical protein F5X98DRAFT_121760 [Xylaria grammica]|nr:hypothetical protein F5X98DRAFT_121760 [Xylaria grammica]
MERWTRRFSGAQPRKIPQTHFPIDCAIQKDVPVSTSETIPHLAFRETGLSLPVRGHRAGQHVRKAFHTWRSDKQDSPYPFGIPELVMGLTRDGQITPNCAVQHNAIGVALK